MGYQVGDCFLCGDEKIIITDVYIDNIDGNDYGCVSYDIKTGKEKFYFDITEKEMYEEKWLKQDER